jgi:hypothetical protein
MAVHRGWGRRGDASSTGQGTGCVGAKGKGTAVLMVVVALHRS